MLIPLGDGSRFDNLELRYALRSVATHLKGVRKVYVVGEDPGFVGGDAVHVPLPDFQVNKEARIALKVLWACREIRGLSEEFLFGNDDHFFVQPCEAPAYPFYYSGPLRRAINRNSQSVYQKSLQATHEALTEHCPEPLNYDIHTPIRYRRQEFIRFEPWWLRSAEREEGFVVKSVYGNLSQVGGQQLHDSKLARPLGTDQVRRFIGARHVFSVSDRAVQPGVASLLRELFPKPCRFERR